MKPLPARSPTEEFEKLKKKWYEKLKKSGFKDIERQDSDSLIIWSQNAYRERTGRDDIIWNEAKRDYYRMAEHFLNENKFETPTHKKIWELHSEGVGVDKIIKKLASKGKKVSKCATYDIIRDLAQQMLDKFGVKSRG